MAVLFEDPAAETLRLLDRGLSTKVAANNDDGIVFGLGKRRVRPLGFTAWSNDY